MPMAIALLNPDMDLWKPGEHNGTFRGNQLSFVAAKAGLDYMLENNVEAETRRKGEIVKNFIENEILPLDSRLEYRGMGLIWGIDFAGFDDDELSEKVIHTCFKNKLVIEGAGRKNSVVKLMPPLVIEDNILLEGLEILKKSIAECLK